jgi:hypothetical protein
MTLYKPDKCHGDDLMEVLSSGAKEVSMQGMQDSLKLSLCCNHVDSDIQKQKLKGSSIRPENVA